MNTTGQGAQAPRQIYSFEGTAPEERPPSRRGMWAIGAVFVLLFLGIIVFSNSNQTPMYSPRPYTTTPAPAPAPAGPPASRPIYTIGTPNLSATWAEPRVIPCPTNFTAAERCQAITLPASGVWVRRNKPRGRGYVVPDLSDIDARGCNGEIHVLAMGPFKLNTDCGYTEFRSADGQEHVYYEGIIP